MLTRILTAAVALAILIPVMIFGGVWGVCAIFAVISAFSIYEMLECCGLRRHYSLSVPMIAIALLIPLFKGLSLFAKNKTLESADIFAYKALLSVGSVAVTVLFAIAVIWVIFVATLKYNKIDAEKLFMFFGLFVYIQFGFLSLVSLGSAVEPGVFSIKVLAFVLIMAWATDTFAYFTGMAFGKKKLCPDISPKKTVAGAIGGTLLGSAAGAVYILLILDFSALSIVLAACAPVFSVISQFGDLGASVIKRKFGVKDYGKLFPGHGGVLDRFDSVIPVSIAVYAVCLIADAVKNIAG
ncbi:MAG: phosphatidate cytidylyltransferase [Clostridia bacterium]|nr:phosphatidate cytidylyltransferase [Clostridia bacterium]